MFRSHASLFVLVQAKTLRSCPATSTVFPGHRPPRTVRVLHPTHHRSLRISTVNGFDPKGRLAMTETGPKAAADNTSSHGPKSLRALSIEIHNRVDTFLQEDVKTERLKKVQAQTKTSLRVIEDALHRYRLVKAQMSQRQCKIEADIL